MSAPLILGINAAYHESAAALLRGDEVLLAVEEERFTRRKHAKQARVDNPDALPWRAIDACLQAAGARLQDVDAVAYSLSPGLRAATVGQDPYPIPAGGFGTDEGEAEFDRRVRGVPALLAERAGEAALADRVRFVPHHLAHAASAFHASPFGEAAVLVVDGIGERSSAWLGRGQGRRLERLEEVPYPHSIGLLWERVAVHLGFTEYDAGKVMGLSAYGDPDRLAAEMGRLLRVPDPHGAGELPFLVDPEVVRPRAADTAGLASIFGPPRQPGEDPTAPRFADLAAALQRRTEEAVLALGRRLFRAAGLDRLAYAGGVALNCLANARLEREGPFSALYVIGASHDAGTALGAAFALGEALLGPAPPPARARGLDHALGPAWGPAEVDRAVAACGLQAEVVPDPVERAAALLVDGVVLGWFQGRLELGPRALGHRSLLVDPRRLEHRERLNRAVKHREPFRPFAASLLASEAAAWLELPADRPGAASSRDLMVLAYPVRPERRAEVPAVVHHDGTCRVQVVQPEPDPTYHALLSAFHRRSGVPLLLNTSLNDREPICASPADALATFGRGGIDALFLGDRLVRRTA